MCLLIKWGISIYLNIYIFTWLIELSISKKKKGKLNGNSLQYITNHELKPNTDALPKTNKKKTTTEADGNLFRSWNRHKNVLGG